MTIRTYKTPQDYLNDTEALLEERELENNLILGLCRDFPDRMKEQSGCYFVNACDNDAIRATAVRTSYKVMVYGTTDRKEYIKSLVEYYQDNNIDLRGVIGERFYAQTFSEYYPKEKIADRTMLVHGLTMVNAVALADGHLEVAKEKDKELFLTWASDFYTEANPFSRRSGEEMVEMIVHMIRRETLFTWVDRGEIVSIAALVRRTKNIGIVGLVYTPNELRGKGYATSCVQKLSAYILDNGFRQCGLFTDKANPISNSIYRKIGYEASSEFSDIKFE